MKIGIKDLVYTPFTSGGEGSAVVYGTGVALVDYMVRADIGEERDDNGMHADDHKIDSDNSLNGMTLGLELANMTDDMEVALFGYVVSSSVVSVTDAAAPFVGIGFVQKKRFKGTVSWTGYWFYKVQFSMDTDSTQTKAESIDWQTHSLSGNCMAVTLTSGGAGTYMTKKTVSTEADALAFVKGCAGIST